MLSFASDVIFFVGSFPVTNTLLNTLFVDLVLVLIIIGVNKNLSLTPGRIQNIAELLIGGFYSFTETIAGKKSKQIFPYFMTFFLFILIANWSGLIPGFTTIGIVKDHDHLIPLLRSTTSDLNTTLGLAMVSLAATHMMSLRTLGPTEYLARFIPFFPFFVSVVKGKPKISIDMSSPLNMVMSVFNPLVLIFVGALEFVSEFVKVISLSFRLFGNIFAGEVVLETVSHIFAFIFPLPFLMLEFIVGAVQALVFAMLTLAFMVILTTPHTGEAHEEVS